MKTPEDRQGPWVASNSWPNASHLVGAGPRSVRFTQGRSSEKQEPGGMILGLIREPIPPSRQLLLSQALTLSHSLLSQAVTNEHLSSLLHLGCARHLPAIWEKHVQHDTALWYQARPTQARSDASHKTAPAETLRDASRSSAVLHCILWICLLIGSSSLPKCVRKAPAQDYGTDTAAHPHHFTPPVCQY